jgi:phosphomannomutase
VVNLTTSSVVDDVVAARGGKVYRTPVGEANVVEMMRAVNAVIGGEGANGGIIFPAVHLCRDSYLGMALLLDRMAETGCTISQLAGQLPQYARRLGKTTFEHGKLGPLMQAVEDRFPGAKLDRSDGLKVVLQDAWVHVRASNTEPILRIAAEARTDERADQLYADVTGLIGSA